MTIYEEMKKIIQTNERDAHNISQCTEELKKIQKRLKSEGELMATALDEAFSGDIRVNSNGGKV